MTYCVQSDIENQENFNLNLWRIIQKLQNTPLLKAYDYIFVNTIK